MYQEPHVGSECGELIREPPAGLDHMLLKDNIAPCKQAAERLQVLGQERGRAGIFVCSLDFEVDQASNESSSCLHGK